MGRSEGGEGKWGGEGLCESNISMDAAVIPQMLHCFLS